MTDFRALEDQYSTGVYFKREAVMVRGNGALVWDQSGKEYIDCIGGHGSANVGHCNPAVIAAIQRQAETLTTCTEVLYNDARALALEKIASITPPGLDRIFLTNSGTESIEAALKFARMSTGRSEIVACMRGFHGRTMGSLSATWDPKYRDPFMPLVPDFKHVPFDNIQAMTEAVSEKTAAVMIELVQGEGGVRPASRDFVQNLASLCERHGALLIIDEIQTGFARTGTMFACEQYEVMPDILCMAKSIAGGLPMGAIAISSKVQNIIKLAHGSTFGGNPIVCAASVATIDFIKRERLAERAQRLGERFRQQLQAIDTELIREIRGLGLMVGVEMRLKTTPYLRALMERGVLALPAGATVVRFLPPLVISEEQLDTVVERFSEAIAAC